MSTSSTPTATTTAPYVRPPRIIIRSRAEIIRIKRLKRNLANAHPDVSRYAFQARCPAPESEASTPVEIFRKDNKSLGKKLGTTLFHRECLIKKLGVFGTVATSEKRRRMYKNWVKLTESQLREMEDGVSEEYRRLKFDLVVEKNKVRRNYYVHDKNRPALEKRLREIQDEEVEAATAYVRECQKVRRHRLKMEKEMREIKDLLSDMSQYPQGDLAKIWGGGFDSASKNLGRRYSLGESSESDQVSELVLD
ncbi:hypothetical protein EAE96_008423 [Botrytis aclada]|nr:hypothetical protein EAE96_008423 [Botrytis aclada]